MTRRIAKEAARIADIAIAELINVNEVSDANKLVVNRTVRNLLYDEKDLSAADKAVLSHLVPFVFWHKKAILGAIFNDAWATELATDLRAAWELPRYENSTLPGTWEEVVYGPGKPRRITWGGGTA